MHENVKTKRTQNEVRGNELQLMSNRGNPWESIISQFKKCWGGTVHEFKLLCVLYMEAINI